MSREHKVCATLNYIEFFLFLAFKITEFISTSPFASLLRIPMGITSSPIGLKICAVFAGIKKCKSIVNPFRTAKCRPTRLNKNY